MKARFYFIVTLTIASVAWFYESHQIGRQAKSLATEQGRALRLRLELTALQRQREEALRDASDAEHELQLRLPAADPATATDPSRVAQTNAWLANVKRLKQSFADFPAQSIPELKLLTELDWLTLARTLSADSELEWRKARSAARTQAIKRFTPSLGAALRAYTATHDGNLPTKVAQLLPYFATPIDPDLLQRYTMTASGNIRTMHGEAVGERAAVDEEFDPRYSVSATGATSSFNSWAEALYDRAATQAVSDFAAANNGQKPKTAAAALPYVHDPTIRPIVEARVRFDQDHPKEVPSNLQLRPYVTEPAATAFLEKLIAADQKRNLPRR